MALKKEIKEGLVAMAESLERMLNASAREYKEHIKQVRRSLKALKTTDIGNAEYIVALNSLWADDGELSTVTHHQGTLGDAVEAAEAEFKATNKRKDIQALYSVSIRLDGADYAIPEEFWEKYKRRR